MHLVFHHYFIICIDIALLKKKLHIYLISQCVLLPTMKYFYFFLMGIVSYAFDMSFKYILLLVWFIQTSGYSLCDPTPIDSMVKMTFETWNSRLENGVYQLPSVCVCIAFCWQLLFPVQQNNTWELVVI